MPEENTTSANPQAGNGAGATQTGGANPQAGNGAPTVNPQAGNSGQKPAGGSGDPNQPQLSHEDALEALRKERLALADARTKLKRLDELEKAAKDAADATLSEQEKLSQQLSDLQATHGDLTYENQQLKLELGVMRAATKLGITDPDLAIAALYREHRGELEADPDTGAYTNLDKLLAQVVKNHPGIAAAPGSQQGQSTQQSSQRPAVTSGPGASPPRSQVPQNPQPRDLTTQPIRRLSDIEWKR